MISVVIETKDEEQALAVTLSALVPAAAQGFLREVIVADAGSRDATRLVAESVGCLIIEGGREAALRAARADWVLLVAPGVRLEAGWAREAALFIEWAKRSGTDCHAASFRHAVEEFGLWARLGEIWAALSSHFRASPNLLAPRHAFLAGARLRRSCLRSRAFVGGPTQAYE
jgi:glycosyltransferase involved in cell wall biosynthesis